MNLILLGPPGAGKGTQAKLLANKLQLKHISTGDLLRRQISLNTKIGLESDNLISQGQFVSDQLATTLLENELPKENFILDGYPRNINQVHILENMNLKIDKVICLEVSDKIIAQRMSGRKICPACGAMYHDFYHPPIKKDICDCCNNNLIQRKDDKLMTVYERLKIYHKLTEPIINFYSAKKLLLRVSADNPINSITEFIINALANL